jgi:hypothetical protein
LNVKRSLPSFLLDVKKRGRVYKLGSGGAGELGSWGARELGSGGTGERGNWGAGERGELGSWERDRLQNLLTVTGLRIEIFSTPERDALVSVRVCSQKLVVRALLCFSS